MTWTEWCDTLVKPMWTGCIGNLIQPVYQKRQRRERPDKRTSCLDWVTDSVRIRPSFRIAQPAVGKSHAILNGPRTTIARPESRLKNRVHRV
jgi:hypothetical protein